MMSNANPRASVLAPWSCLLLSLIGWLGVQGSWWLLGAALAPLLVATPGLLTGKRYTHAWAAMLTVVYAVIGLTETFANPASRAWAGLFTVTTVWTFAALLKFVRTTNPSEQT